MDLSAFIHQEVKPALGCTEPAAVALAAAQTAKLLGRTPDRLHLRLSSNLCKNAMNVGIPGAGGLRGSLVAAALGAVAARPEAGLLVLQGLTPDQVERARRMANSGDVTLEVVQDAPPVYVEVEASAGERQAVAVVAHRHDLLTESRLDGRVVSQGAADAPLPAAQPAYLRDLTRMRFADLWRLAGRMDKELEDFLLSGVEMNLDVARAGLSEPWGLGVGRTMAGMDGEGGLLWEIKTWCAAAADARMGGATMAVMSSAGSGNHGITAVIPPALAARRWGATDRSLAEALAVSHLVTGFLKARIGRLSPVCGCAVAAGAGAAAGLAKLAGGAPSQGEGAVANMLSAVLGMICDGAKAGCAHKVSASAGEAYVSAMLALKGSAPAGPEGIIGPVFRDNAAAVGEVSALGLAGMDAVVLRLMEKSATRCP